MYSCTPVDINLVSVNDCTLKTTGMGIYKAFLYLVTNITALQLQESPSRKQESLTVWSQIGITVL